MTTKPPLSLRLRRGSRPEHSFWLPGCDLLSEHLPYTPLTAHNLEQLANLQPKILAMMHGCTIPVTALSHLNAMLREIFGREQSLPALNCNFGRRLIMRFSSNLLTVLALVAAALILSAVVGALPHRDAPKYDASGRLLPPAAYRDW